MIGTDGSPADFPPTAFQDKVQIDPSEEPTYTPGSGRRVFQAGELKFGISIYHEGFRYPETIRWWYFTRTSTRLSPASGRPLRRSGQEGPLLVDLGLTTATGLLAARCRSKV